MNPSKYIFTLLIALFSYSGVFSQGHNLDSLTSIFLEKNKYDRFLLPTYDRIDSDITFKELDLSKYKVKIKEGIYLLEVKICGHKVLLPKSNDLTSRGGVKFNDLLLDNGNILVANGWIHTLVIGAEDHNSIITTYVMGLIESTLYLLDNKIVKYEASELFFLDCN